LKALELSQPYLGAMECEGAFTVPTEGPSDRFSYTFVRLVSEADFVYLLCVDCGRIAVPSAWRGKVLLVDGLKIDECVQDFNVDHWHRASFSHAVAVAHARGRGYGNVAIVEDDSRSDFTVVFSDSDYEQFNKLLRSPGEWNFIRLGWRPYRLEEHPEDEACPAECKCARSSSRTCVISGGGDAGCDIRSSDAYFITRGAYDDFVNRLQDGVVDFNVLQTFDKMTLLTPQLSYQEKLDISMESQRNLQASFNSKCVHDPILDNANGAASGLTAPYELNQAAEAAPGR